jgi:hypothetical protein
MSTIIRAGGTKGSLYGDSSNRTAALRSRAIILGQSQKIPGNPTDFLSAEGQLKKPLISEHHLTKGSTNGVKEVLWIKNKDGFF